MPHFVSKQTGGQIQVKRCTGNGQLDKQTAQFPDNFGKLNLKGLDEFTRAQTHYMKTQIDGETVTDCCCTVVLYK